MSSKREVTFSVTAIAAVIVLFASAPLIANQQTQAQMFASGVSIVASVPALVS